jgi:hypothetical protein
MALVIFLPKGKILKQSAREIWRATVCLDINNASMPSQAEAFKCRTAPGNLSMEI